MATADRNGPALDQAILVYQGAPATYVVPVSDPDGTRPDLTGASAAWWVGPRPLSRAGAMTVMGAPGAFTQSLPVEPDGVDGWRVILSIEPEDLAGFAPTGLYQHEIWVTEVGKRPYPVTIGPLVLRGTVKGAA